MSFLGGKGSRGRAASSALAFLLLAAVPALQSSLLAWPADQQWFPVLKSGEYLQDPNNDANGSRNVVSGPGYPAAFIFNDGDYIYFRLRLDQDPTGTGGQGFLKSFGWGVLFDTNLNAADYEWLIMVDGINQTEIIGLWQNTVQGTLGSPSDSPELLVHSVPVSVNHRAVPADTSFNGDLDYFLDWRFPYETLKQYTGLTDDSPIRLFFGSSPSATTLRDSGGDLVGASDLYSGFSDYITPFGAAPTTGTLRFAADLAGNGTVAQECIGNTLYVRVADGDQNYNPTAVNSVTATLSVPGGDSEPLVLQETGVNTGVFTGSIPLAYGTPTPGDGLFQAAVGAVITATYIDAIDALLQRNQPRTATLLVCGPVIDVAKTAAPGIVAAGATVTYTITISNTGTGAASVTRIRDVLPDNFSYQAGSTSGLTNADPAVNGQILTWNGAWTVPAGESRQLAFQAAAGGFSGTWFNNASVSGTNFPAFHTGDTAPVTVGAPQMALAKTADRVSAAPGEKITYAIHYRNTGDGAANFVIITDTIPVNTTYEPGSLRIGAADSDYETATILTDAADADQGQASGTMVVFSVGLVAPDDGVPGSGPDEGKVYFRVTVD